MIKNGDLQIGLRDPEAPFLYILSLFSFFSSRAIILSLRMIEPAIRMIILKKPIILDSCTSLYLREFV